MYPQPKKSKKLHVLNGLSRMTKDIHRTQLKTTWIAWFQPNVLGPRKNMPSWVGGFIYPMTLGVYLTKKKTWMHLRV